MLQKKSVDKAVLALLYALMEKLDSDFDFSMDSSEKNTIKGYADGVKVDFLAHKYPMINERLEIEDLFI